MALNRMHQIEVYRLGNEINWGSNNLSFTNASLFRTISAATMILLLFIGTKKKSLITAKIKLINEISYSFVANMQK